MLFLPTIQKYQMLNKGDRVLAAVSGGADSLALLYGLLDLQNEYLLNIYVIHVNHNLRGEESDKDADFVKNICQELNLPLFYYSAKMKNSEEAARLARYSYLYKAAEECGANKIALGHNQNDNAETLLLRLCRGTGLAGLKGIPPVRTDKSFILIRPLINTSRDSIESYLNERKRPYRTDSSNFNTDYQRNRVRHKILPSLQKINPQIINHLAKSAALLRDDEELLSSLCADFFKNCIFPHENVVKLDIKKLLAAPPALQKRAIRQALSLISGLRDVSQSHISQIEALLGKQSGKEVHLPSKLRARREYGYLLIYSDNNKINDTFCLEITPDNPLFVPAIGKYVQVSIEKACTNSQEKILEICTKYFNYDKIRGSLQIRSRLPGDRIYIGGLGRKKLSDEFCDLKIPRDLRDSIPLLACGSDILWIVTENGRTSAAFPAEPGCKLLKVTIGDGTHEGNH